MEILYIDVDWKEFMIASNETSIAEKSREWEKKLEKLKKEGKSAIKKKLNVWYRVRNFLSAFLIIDATQGGSFKNINDKIILEILI